MHTGGQRIGRDIGYAVAALAMYLLTLLLPLHQAAGLQRDLDRLGFSTLGAISICSPGLTHPDGDPETPNALKCPASGIGKHDFVGIVPPAIRLPAPTGAVVMRYFASADGIILGLRQHYGQARAPPVAV